MISCWSAKGGSGTTVVAVALSVLLGRSVESGSVLVDLGGDCPTVLGVAQPEGPGLSDWLAASGSVGPAALSRLETFASDGVRLLPRGRRPFLGGSMAEPASRSVTGHDGERHADPIEERIAGCTERLAGDERPVIVDVGRVGAIDGDAVRRGFIEASTTSLLVTRACFLSLRRSLELPFRPTGVVLVEEAGRALGRADVENVLNAPVIATVAVEPAIARAVDAGLLASRLPSPLGRALRDVA